MSRELKYFLAWFPMVFIAFANAWFRESVIRRLASELFSHQLSTLLLILLLAVYIRILFKKIPPISLAQALLTGMMWAALTIVFEFGMGRSRGIDWRVMLHDYQLSEGRIWILVPLTLVIAPGLIYQWLGRSK
jgi:hypothetical protein